jgi:hypothetical protein
MKKPKRCLMEMMNSCCRKNEKTKKMLDGNDEQLLCLLTFKYLAFKLEFSQELLKLEI